MNWSSTQKGFTIVELLIVIVIIAILAAVTILGFNGVQKRALEAGLSADLQSTSQQLEQDKILSGSDTYEPAVLSKYLATSGTQSTTEFIYGSKSSFCMQVKSIKPGSQTYYIDSKIGINAVQAGTCPTPTGSATVRCISGQVIISMTQRNNTGQTVSMSQANQYETNTVTANAGSSGSTSTSTRVATVPRGLVTIVLSGISPSTYSETFYYVQPAFSC